MRLRITTLNKHDDVQQSLQFDKFSVTTTQEGTETVEGCL